MKRRYGLLIDAREAKATLATLASCPSFAMEFVAAAEAESAAAGEVTSTPGSESEQQSGPQMEGDPLALYGDYGNGRVTCAQAR